MLRTRVIPGLLLREGGLVKTTRFAQPRYIGDPINAVRIFNDKEVDELLFLDISATLARRGPDLDLIRDIASEAFMPFAYGGGVRSLKDVQDLIELGVEKVVLNTAAVNRPALIREVADLAGSQSVAIAIDVRKPLLRGYEVMTTGGTVKTGLDPVNWAREVERLGAGEIILTSIDRDGTMKGYDLDLIASVSSAVGVPVVASGGAGRLQDFVDAALSGASAVAAGSMFVFHGPHRAVLITYPGYSELEHLLGAVSPGSVSAREAKK